MDGKYPGDDAGDGEDPRPMTAKRMWPDADRRRQLLEFALDLADQVERRTEPHERCLLRRMVEHLVDA